MTSRTWLHPQDVSVYTISVPEERSKDPLLDCHQISWVTACLKFTAVNIPNTGQLSLAWPEPLITTRLVHYVTCEGNTKPLKVKWSAFILLDVLWVKRECWWVETHQMAINVCYRGRSCIKCQNVSSCQLELANWNTDIYVCIHQWGVPCWTYFHLLEKKNAFPGGGNQNLLVRHVRTKKISPHYFYREDGCMIARRQLQQENTYLSET